jgi:outer membrane protein OmpA-like peptidoglycan-associated protein
VQTSLNVLIERNHQSDFFLRSALLEHGKGVEPSRLRDAARNAAIVLIGTAVIFAANGCLATRGWVQEQINPVTERLNNTDAKADRALAGLQDLHLEQKLVLDDSGQAPTFAFGSASLSPTAKRKIAGFINDLQGSSTDSGSNSGRLFVVAGHTDNTGPASYNYKLGQQRAESVAGYLISHEGIDPMQIRVVSYGATKPIANNGTLSGRRSNRRVEILVYQEKIVASK